MSSACSWRCGTLREASTLWRKGMQVHARGEAVAAEAMQRKALSLVFSLGGFPVVQARIHNNLGVILACAGRKADARQEFRRALYLVKGLVAPQTRFHQVLAANFRAVDLRPLELPRQHALAQAV